MNTLSKFISISLMFFLGFFSMQLQAAEEIKKNKALEAQKKQQKKKPDFQ